MSDGLKARTLRGSLWTFAGYAAQHALRLGNNLILTRLLFREAFGLMSIVQAFMTGLEMLSDVGLGPSIIQGKRGADPVVLRTAWTLQAVRGVLLGLAAAGLAWPVARFYGDPRLLALLPVAGLGVVLRGFGSMRILTLNRTLELGRLTAVELASQAFAVAVTILAAWRLRSVWALLIGSHAGVLARVALSHAALRGPRDGFGWDREALRELGKVGRWVFLSTAVTFLVGKLDILAMGRLLDRDTLGVYSIAALLGGALPLIARTVGSRVFFPMLAETLREDPARLGPRLRKIRLSWVLPVGAALAALALGGHWLVRILYDAPFQDAGWMLRLLAAGSLPMVLNQSTGVVWSALGRFRALTLLMVAQSAILFGFMLAGHAWGGARGVVAGIALVEAAVYPILAVMTAREGLWQPSLDLPVLAASALLFLLLLS